MFWTNIQESFYASYVHQGSQLSQHRMLQFKALRVAAGGEPILPFFDYLQGLADLVSKRSRYVPDWVRVFHATVYVEADRLSLHFMFMGQQQRLTRERGVGDSHEGPLMTRERPLFCKIIKHNEPTNRESHSEQSWPGAEKSPWPK
jgi:hypothetical protein